MRISREAEAKAVKLLSESEGPAPLGTPMHEREVVRRRHLGDEQFCWFLMGWTAGWIPALVIFYAL